MSDQESSAAVRMPIARAWAAKRAAEFAAEVADLGGSDSCSRGR